MQGVGWAVQSRCVLLTATHSRQDAHIKNNEFEVLRPSFVRHLLRVTPCNFAATEYGRVELVLRSRVGSPGARSALIGRASLRIASHRISDGTTHLHTSTSISLIRPWNPEARRRPVEPHPKVHPSIATCLPNPEGGLGANALGHVAWASIIIKRQGTGCGNYHAKTLSDCLLNSDLCVTKLRRWTQSATVTRIQTQHEGRARTIAPHAQSIQERPRSTCPEGWEAGDIESWVRAAERRTT